MTYAEDVGTPDTTARCIALVQEHRGHGVSTAAYYLARALVAQRLRVLLVDLTGRGRQVLPYAPVKNLVFWAPPLARPLDIAPLLERARHETAGRCDVILLDIDAALLEHVGGFALGIAYVAVVTEATVAGQQAAERVAERLGEHAPSYQRIGVIFSRVDAPTAEDLPEQTERKQVSVLGYYPADYLLAGGDAYSLKGNEPAAPHDIYLYALVRIAQRLIRLVPLRRLTTTTPVVADRVGAARDAGDQSTL